MDYITSAGILILAGFALYQESKIEHLEKISAMYYRKMYIRLSKSEKENLKKHPMELRHNRPKKYGHKEK